MNIRASSAARASFSGFFLEGDVEGLLENIRHVFLSILDTENFGQSLEPVLESA